MRVAGGLILGALLVCAGCKTDQAARQAENLDHPEPPAVAALGPGDAGKHQRERSRSKALRRRRLKIDMSQDPACAMAGRRERRGAVVIGKKGGAGERLRLREGRDLPPNVSFPAKTSPVVVDQKGCRYVPHVVAVQVGEPVEFHNSDPTMHNVHTLPAMAGNASADISQGPMGAPQSETFSQPEEMLPVRCNNHPWMNAFVNVSATPFFAVTARTGSSRSRACRRGCTRSSPCTRRWASRRSR